jgi:superfamily II DNA or RNA helicase
MSTLPSGGNIDTDRPTFATNRPALGQTVHAAVSKMLRHFRGLWFRAPHLAIATAYFNCDGFSLLADELEAAGGTQLLLGVEPRKSHDPALRSIRFASARQAERVRHSRELDEHLIHLKLWRDAVTFEPASREKVQRLVRWLRSGKVQVRRFEQGFVHGKAFIVVDGNSAAMVGSANFTAAGLSANLELEVGVYSPDTVSRITSWFNELWEQSEPFDLASLYEAKFALHAPHIVFLRMLWEIYGDELLSEEHDTGTVAEGRLTEFQRHGAWRARKILERRNGVIIADEVGLGKTFIAGALLRETIVRRQRAIVLGPAALRGTWRQFLLDEQLPVEYLSFDELLNGAAAYQPHEYSLVVVDEAHALRNLGTLRSQAMTRLLGGDPPKSLVLVTATPVNNSLDDIRNLLSYFIKDDAAFVQSGIVSIAERFRSAQLKNPDDLSPEYLFDILDQVAVRRTRRFVRKYYTNDVVTVDGIERPIVFPEPRVLKVEYELEAVIPGFFERFEEIVGGTDRYSRSGQLLRAGSPALLSLARYTPSNYRVDGAVSQHEVQNAGLIRTTLLKRFESSAHAFVETCKHMLIAHQRFLEALQRGVVLRGKMLQEWISSDSDDIGELIANTLSAASDYDGSAEDAKNYDVERLRDALMRDMALLEELRDAAAVVTKANDPKLQALIGELRSIVRDATREGTNEDERRDKRKVIVFTYFTSTAHWIYQALQDIIISDPELHTYNGRLALVSGQDGARRDELVQAFAPKTMRATVPDAYDLLIATDVLAEGVNLQQARHVVNFDLPWNPMRLVQRHGRIDRIGSEHRHVYLRCFFPDVRLDEMLGLEAILRRKYTQAARSIGTSKAFPDIDPLDINLTESRDEIARLAAGDATLFEEGGDARGALSGEELRQRLRTALLDGEMLRLVKELPLGAGSGFVHEGSERLFVFCARILDHDAVQFRVVAERAGDGMHVGDDLLTALTSAAPPGGFAEAGVLPEDRISAAFSAWQRALGHIVERWNWSADPANTAPQVPAAMREAVRLMRAKGHQYLPIAEVDRLVDVLEGAYPPRLQRRLREVLSNAADDESTVSAIRSFVRENGLQATAPRERLPLIVEEDVRLVCWMSVSPS